jgi:hypothetical protein
MKTIFTLLLATLFSSAAFAYDEGKLTVTVATKNSVQILIDGRAYQDDDNTFVVNNIQAGNHTIKIYKASKNNGRNIRNDRRSNDLLFSSTVYVRPAYHVDVMINRFGKALVDEKAIADRNGAWGDDDWNNGNGNGGYGNNGGYNNGGYNTSQAMSDYDFNQLVVKIKNQWFGSGKLNAAKDGVNNNYLNTTQVRQIVQIFSSEADKLELAKLAYRKIVDQQNFRQLYDLFSYQGQTELDNYTRYNR